MFDSIKNNLFTLSGFITSLIHFMLVVGVLASWIFFNIQFMGNDVSLSLPGRQAMQEHFTGRK